MDVNTLLSIKEFSDFTGFAQSTLRYYDEIGLFPPAVRGENNYRYYAPFQTITINFIEVLINLGVPLSRIKELALERTPESILALLARQEGVIDGELRRLQSAYSVIHTFRDNIQTGILAREDEISVQDLPETSFVMGIANNFDNNQYFYEPFISFSKDAEAHDINLNYPVGGYFETMDAFLREPSQPARFFTLDPHGKSKKPAGQYLVGYVRGYYGDMGELPQRLTDYADEHKLSFVGSVYVIYPLDEISIIDHTQYLAQVSVQISDIY